MATPPGPTGRPRLPIEDVSIDPDDYDLGAGDVAEGELTVTGTVVSKPIRDVVVTDGTDYAGVTARFSAEEVNHDVVDAGDCQVGTGHVNLRQSTTQERPVIEATDLADGDDCPDAEPLPAPPRLTFETDWNPGDEEFAIVRTGGDDVAAGDLVVRWRSGGSQTFWTAADRATWAALADVPADEAVPSGSEIRFERTSLDVSILWTDPDRAWSSEVESPGVSAA